MDYVIARVFAGEFDTFRRGGRPFEIRTGKVRPKQEW